ncbi:hypothetical protein [Microbacterium oxydans]|uniref:hypothetical protein n=1 Tax=Microbacterium oxydans TaxID=82380 RepID=UPI003670AEC1
MDAADLAAEPTAAERYAPGGDWHYAESLSARVFFITTDWVHPDTGETIITPETAERVIARKGNLRAAWINHDKDQYTADDVERNPRAVIGQTKPAHVHIIEERRNQTTVAAVARAYGVAPNFVEPKKGHGAFLDVAEYLTHEHEKQQKLGKHRYDDAEVHANFDFRAEVDAHVASRGKPGASRKVTPEDALALRVLNGELTVAQAMTADPLSFSRAKTRIRGMRAEFLAHQPPPQQRINIYLEGPGGIGKDLLAKALARTLMPGEWEPGVRDPFFAVGGDNVSWEGYDGQQVVIIEEARAGSLIKKFGRTELFQLLSPFPTKQLFNVKNASTQLLHTVTILTGPDSYADFLDGLAGGYVDRFGQEHKAENKAQAYRRFPIIIPVREGQFSLAINKGFVNGTRDFQEYETYGPFRQSMQLLATRAKGISDAQRRVETQLALEARQVRPIVEQHARVIAATETSDEDADALLAEFDDLGEHLPTAATAPLVAQPLLDPAAWLAPGDGPAVYRG